MSIGESEKFVAVTITYGRSEDSVEDLRRSPAQWSKDTLLYNQPVAW